MRSGNIDIFRVSRYDEIIPQCCFLTALPVQLLRKRGMDMTTKVCPCCDQPIKGMYCKGCRKIVLHPVVQDIHYYLNERHPEYETDCSYHGNTAGNGKVADPNVRAGNHKMTPHETEAKKAEIKERMQQKQREIRQPGTKVTTKSATQPANKPTTKSTAQTPPKALRKFLIAIAIYVIINIVGVLMTISQNVADIFDHLEIGKATPEPGVAVEEVAVAPDIDTRSSFGKDFPLPTPMETDEAAMAEWELTDEQVKEIGLRCNGFGHFPMEYGEAVRIMDDCIGDAGYGWNMSTYSYNQFIDDDTWYETVYEFTVRNEKEYAGFINVETDTVTGELHGIHMYTAYEEGFFKLTDIAMDFLGRAGIAGDLPAGAEFFKEAYLMQEERGDGVCLRDGMEVVCYFPEDDEINGIYQMSIYAPGYYTTAPDN